ncbi:fumarylacetoacetase [Bradyrhizobium neotropicale]|uniref:fumarylacetoacetase n=1 Tax=Bradyrhizobium neotropicale TaxID=1497615 RepID=UPI001AD6EFC6|nr:fumarylacetoacetase [Bradyrhizobium neotropicale]MBO4226831.1 fumarylacetoacetase [Bradyrhizobium neotropicale]
MTELDETHDAARRSWVASANGHRDFPIQNLPFGVVSARGERPFGAVAIGDMVLNLAAARESGMFAGNAAGAVDAMVDGTLNGFLALGSGPRRALRKQLFAMLSEHAVERESIQTFLLSATDCKMQAPAHIGNYSDFFVGIHHATNTGRLFRPENPLLPNYKYVPIGYHGRASSVVPSGTEIRRPRGQIKTAGSDVPLYEPCRRLDYELELGLWVGPGNALGEPISISQAGDRIAGICLLNDWSARDIQTWESQPLGPFLSKSFATTISPWIVTPEALAPFRTPQPPRAPGDPAPLPHLLDSSDQSNGAFDIRLDVHILTPKMRAAGHDAFRLARSNAQHMYWTAAQLVAHHTSNGCNLQAGDLMGTGTISGPDRDGCGALLETTRGGQDPVSLPSGEERAFLEDGDEIILTASCERKGYVRIGFGECRGTIAGSVSSSKPD